MTTALDHAHQLAADISAQTGEPHVVIDDDGHPLIVAANPTVYELLEECRATLRLALDKRTAARHGLSVMRRTLRRLNAALGE